jgi:hypothetical protein
MGQKDHEIVQAANSLYLVLVYEFGTVRGGVSMCMVA